MATSTIKGGFYHKEGTQSVAHNTVATLDTFTPPNGTQWLVFGRVSVTSSGAVSSSNFIQSRLEKKGKLYIGIVTPTTNISAFSNAYTDGETVKLNTYHNCGSTQTVSYDLTAIRIK